MKWYVSATCPPPNAGVDHWVRSEDPWHRDAFPTEHKDAAPSQTPVRRSGWMSEDWCGNPERFIADGTLVSNGY